MPNIQLKEKIDNLKKIDELDNTGAIYDLLSKEFSDCLGPVDNPWELEKLKNVTEYWVTPYYYMFNHFFKSKDEFCQRVQILKSSDLNTKMELHSKLEQDEENRPDIIVNILKKEASLSKKIIGGYINYPSDESAIYFAIPILKTDASHQSSLKNFKEDVLIHFETLTKYADLRLRGAFHFKTEIYWKDSFKTALTNLFKGKEVYFPRTGCFIQSNESVMKVRSILPLYETQSTQLKTKNDNFKNNEDEVILDKCHLDFNIS